MAEEKKDNSAKFGKVIDALHSKQKLSSLRTYQGDMAEFIKEKNESVVSIAVKEKEKKEEEKLEYSPKPKKEGLKINSTMFLLSIVLIGAGVMVSLYVFEFIKKEPVSKVVIKEEIIPYNNLITLANLTNKNIGTELAKLSPANGISILKISDTNGVLLQTAKNLFNFLEISLPTALERTLKDEYAIGTISQNNQTSLFIIIVVNDFGRAFSAMLDWEENMSKDLSFLNTEESALIVDTTIATTTNAIASTTIMVKIPMKPETFSWKDLIIKNKDTRALANDKNVAKIAYTFLDKSTILITNNTSAIGEISSIYASRSIVR